LLENVEAVTKKGLQANPNGYSSFGAFSAKAMFVVGHRGLGNTRLQLQSLVVLMVPFLI